MVRLIISWLALFAVLPNDYAAGQTPLAPARAIEATSASLVGEPDADDGLSALGELSGVPWGDGLVEAMTRGHWPRYFVVVFASEDDSKRPKYAHSFGTFIKLSAPLPGSDRPQVQCKTISWLPAEYALNYRLGFGRKPGRNHGLAETLSFAYDRCLNICCFGPYEIDCELYREVSEHIEFLDSGKVKYKVVAMFQRVPPYLHIRGGAMNCINALAQPAGYLASGAKYGCRVSETMIDHYSEHIIGCQRHPWVYELLRENPCCDTCGSCGGGSCGGGSCGGGSCGGGSCGGNYCDIKLPDCSCCAAPICCKQRCTQCGCGHKCSHYGHQ